MAKVDGSQNLKDMFPRCLLMETTGVLLQLLQYGVVDILKYQVQFSFSPKHLHSALYDNFERIAKTLTCENPIISLCKVGKVQR